MHIYILISFKKGQTFMEFTKLHTAGRDYILIENTRLENGTPLPSLAKHICNRYSGAGAGGLIILNNENTSIDVYSHKGIKSDCDLSAAICAAAYRCSKNGISHTLINQNSVSTDILIQKQQNLFEITADFGKATFQPSGIPLTSPDRVIRRPVEVGNRILNITALRLGKVFAVHETQSVADINLISLGEKLTRHSLFNKKASAVFCERISDSSLFIRSYINGVGAVLSDAAAAAAAVLALSETHSLEYGREITVSCEGDESFVLCQPDGSVLINTSAQIVYTGKI